MNESIFFQAFIMSIVYLLFKFIEMRFILKKNKPLKELAREALIVYFSVICGKFVLTQIIPLKELISAPEVFTNDPGF